jgi:hypothetical protein
MPSDDRHTGEPATKDRILAAAGSSQADTATVAGRSAAAEALARLNGGPPALIMVYASVRYDLPALLAGVRDVTGDTPLAGASTSGHFHDGVVTPPGRGVAVLALTAGPYRFGVGSVRDLRPDAVGAGRMLARAARAAVDAPPSPHAALLLLADGLAGNQQELLQGVHKVTGAGVPVIGGAAGDDRRLSQTSVFHDDRVLPGGALAVWVDSPWPLTVVARHGWHPVSLPLLVTRAEGPVVHEIAGRPAVDVFREHFRHDELDQELGWVRRPGYHSAHAFGLLEADGQLLIRGAYLDDAGQLRTFSPLPTYSPVQIVSCQPDDLLEIVSGVVTDAIAGRDAGLVLAFSCVARLDVLRERWPEGAARLHAAAGGRTTFGFYTYGEFARTASVAGYHNATLAAVAL